MPAEQIRVRGLVQGVGFRPTVWRIASQLGLQGDVSNDGEGVLVRLWADRHAIGRFCEQLQAECPPLARIDFIQRQPFVDAAPAQPGFQIIASQSGGVHTGIVPDAATCHACREEIFDPANRRYRYPFTNCTHCGPRLSIIERIPYDRANTSMRLFPMCPVCEAEYLDPADRRFHAQPNACPVCGPQLWLEDRAGEQIELTAEERDSIDSASRLLRQGQILAIKGIGGVHLACDAANPAAVARLRQRKRRPAKPFALMARDATVIRRYCRLSREELDLLQSPAAPILLLDQQGETLPEALAPGQASLGFMLPYTPLHQLLLADWEHPLVMTSGNLSEEPQCVGNHETRRRLGEIADAYLLHDRPIVNRVDDSVARLVAGRPRLLRRARGYAPGHLALPPGFEQAPDLLALGGELKSTLCLLKDGQAILTQHLGDLENYPTFQAYQQTLALYRQLYQHHPTRLVVDSHPGYRSHRFGRELAQQQGLPLERVQHHHAHIASVMAERGWPLDGGRVLGICLDGSGYGEDGTIWGGELLLVDYRSCQRLGHLQTTALPGGSKAIQEPWRNAFAQLQRCFGWSQVERQWGGLEAICALQQRPVAVLLAMVEQGLNSPLSSSCGRLFDAVAALLGICADGIDYEGQAAVELETAAMAAVERLPEPYPFGFNREESGLVLDPTPMWRALMQDLADGVCSEQIAYAFHLGLASALVRAVRQLAEVHGIQTVALSGGVFQNRSLFEAIAESLRKQGLRLLSHEAVPSNDGGLALGQAVIAAARQIK
ncbi:carbamoyltransferase HypF [Candidatus Endoriftia persephonae]|jgi:hydrogenase maturation protein HypF|uniref:Carbamoyltransferase HypF n=2 Tax=Gammaproteobacteria TaxID=1236 RepID=G2FDA4_9GAMM|nr:carbamoyltransferase HypF [Candidatus Endoriftia persephone]EGW55190.1 [NiFe] hydrogenase maturation protein HypF [endosymbiont of Tevnia jerichonana (vent Tica)]USF88720.1 carbamoyltransferase HypF [Candidatus Endoriftia persephone]